MSNHQSLENIGPSTVCWREFGLLPDEIDLPVVVARYLPIHPGDMNLMLFCEQLAFQKRNENRWTLVSGVRNR
jgi:hypothetical protein